MQRPTSWFRTRCPIKNSVASFSQNTMTASNRSWAQSRRRALFKSNTNCFRLSIFESLRNCRLLEQAREFHEEEPRNAKGNYWGRNNPVGAGNCLPCHGRSAEREENHGSGRNKDPDTNDRFHRHHQTEGGVSVHSEPGDKSAS